MSDEIGRWSREIVAKRAALVALIPIVYSVLIGLGVELPWSQTDTIGWVNGVITVVAVLGTVLWARQGVTVADAALGPKDSEGRALVPVEEGMEGGETL
jgi:hypothetical protein